MPEVQDHSPAGKHTSAERYERMVAIVTIATPLIVTVAATALLWGRLVTLTDVLICLAMYVITMLGITLGFHRLFTHRSFQCVKPVKLMLGIAGSMSAQGPLFFWVASHRKHHKTSDEADDPHSPHHHGGGPMGVIKGCFHAHVGWMLSHKPENYFRLVPDLLRDPTALMISRRYFMWIALGFLLPAVAGGLLAGTWSGVLTGLVWGGFIRLFLVHHATWSINSVCHLFGSRAFDTGDESRNNAVCAALTFGEGWHNNHHAFPASARHGLFWWQVDIVYAIIKVLKMIGLAWDVRLPDQKSFDRKALPQPEATL